MPVFNRSSDQRIESRKAWKTARISGRDANTNRRGYVQFYEEFCAHWRSCVDIRPFSLSGRRNVRDCFLRRRAAGSGDRGCTANASSITICAHDTNANRARKTEVTPECNRTCVADARPSQHSIPNP